MDLHNARNVELQLAGAQDHVRRILAGREFAWAMVEGAWFLENCLEQLDRELTGNSGHTA
jgi:hypothetical protein